MEQKTPEQMLQTIHALEVRCVTLERDRDRYFHMKRSNAGLYADVRKALQDSRAELQRPEPNLALVIEKLGAVPGPDEWLSALLDAYTTDVARMGSLLGSENKAAHLAMMCSKVEEFLTSGQEDKANRWLGFVQGVMWTHGIYTVDQLRAHMRGETP